MSSEIQKQHNSVLTTGTLSGLGRHIFETFGGYSWNRDITDEDRQKLEDCGVDTIIHCAFNSRLPINSNNLYFYLLDNLFLTKKVISIPHDKFVFISSVDVYPRHPNRYCEDEVIDVNQVDGMYGITKLMSESLVRQSCPNFLIIRCSSLLGKYMRKNNLIKILEDDPCILRLTTHSRLNFVLYPDISNFIQMSIKKDIHGIYNVLSSENITVSEIVEMLRKKVIFGTYFYDVGNIDNSKITAILPKFKKTSKEVIDEFISDR